MIKAHGKTAFGFLKEMPYGLVSDVASDFELKNHKKYSESFVIHLDSLDYDAALTFSKDIYTGEYFDAGIVHDGDFMFPLDFVRYFKNGEWDFPDEYVDYVENKA